MIDEISAEKAIAGIREAFKLIGYEGTACSLRFNPMNVFFAGFGISVDFVGLWRQGLLRVGFILTWIWITFIGSDMHHVR